MENSNLLNWLYGSSINAAKNGGVSCQTRRRHVNDTKSTRKRTVLLPYLCTLILLTLAVGNVWGDVASWKNNTMSPASYFTLGSNTTTGTNAQTINGTNYTHSINMTTASGQSSNNTNGTFIRFTLTSASDVSVLFKSNGGSRQLRINTGWSYNVGGNATQISNGATPNDAGILGTSSSVSNGSTGTFTLNNLAAGTYYICSSAAVWVFDISITNAGPTWNTITYKANDGSSDEVVHEYLTGTTVYVAQNYMFSRSGYIFKGWNTKSDASGDWYDAWSQNTSAFAKTISLSSDVTLYAIWATANATVTNNYCISIWNSNDNGKKIFTQKQSGYSDYVLELVVPGKDGSGNEPYYWIGYNNGRHDGNLGQNNAKSANWEFAWTVILGVYEDGRKICLAPGALGTMHIYDNSSEDNLHPRFEPKQYGIVTGSGTLASSSSGIAFHPVERENTWMTDIVKMTSDIKSGNYYVGLLKSDGNFVKAEKAGQPGISVQATMSSMGIYNYSSGWDGSNVGTKISADSYGAFRLWNNTNENNFTCHWVEYYALTYDANNGSGAPAVTGVAQEGNANQRSLKISSTTPTRAGYRFLGWADNYDDTEADYTAGQVITLSANKTVYAVWDCVDPTITTDLLEDEVDYYVGDAATTLTVAATAAGGSVSYQWYSNDEANTTTSTTLTNCTTATYNPSTAAAGTTYYYCVITNSTAGCSTTATSSFAKIVVSRNNPNKYDFTATSASICSGEDATFTLSNSQVGATYYITKSSSGGSAIGDSKAGTGSSLSFTATSATTGDYYCYTTETTAFNAIKVSKNKATISYKTATSVTVDDATLDDAVVDEEYTISGITGAGAGTLYYQWYSYSDDEGSGKDDIDGATSSTYTFTPAAAGDYYFKCKVTGDCGSVKSDMITVTATVACTDPSASFDNGSYTIGGSSLDLRNLWLSSNTSDGVTFSITSGTGTIAGDGYTFSSSTAGSVTITASQTSTGEYCDAAETATITVSNPTYNVSYKTTGSDSGSAPSDATDYEEGDEVTVKDNTGSLEKTDYVFCGWNTASTMDGTFYAPGDKFDMGTANVNLYPVWGQKLNWAMSYSADASAMPTPTKTSSNNTELPQANMSNFSTSTNVSLEASTGKSDASPKITDFATAVAAGDEGIYVTFNVASGYQFTPLRATVSTTATSAAKTIKVSVGSNSQTWSQSKSSGSTPSAHEYVFSSPSAVSGSGVKVNIQAYGDSKTQKFRLGTPITIYGIVEATGYSISFEGNGNTSGSTSSHTSITSGSDVSQLNANGFVKTGYSFSGWKTNTALTYVPYGKSDEAGNRVSAAVNDIVPDKAKIKSVTSNITLTAQWTVNSYTLTWNWGGGSTSATAGTNYTAGGSVNYDTSLEYPANNTMSKTGYTFTGWSSSPSTMPDEDLTITAQWTAKTYTVTLDPDNSASTATVTATYDAAMPSKLSDGETSVAVPTFTNYVFGGYYDDHCGAGTQYYTNVVASANTWDKTSNTTLYALWTQSITLDREGATTGSTSVTATYASATLPSITNPEKDGYTFEGWYSGDDGTGDLVISKAGALQASVSGYTGDGGIWTSTSSRTLYAKWEEEACTSQTISKVVVTGSSAGTTSGYNSNEYVGTPVINVSGKTSDATNIDGVTGNETGYKMSSDGSSIVFATLAKGTFQAGDKVKIGITRRNDTRVISEDKNILTIYYGTNKDDVAALTTISTGDKTTAGAEAHEGAGFYEYTLTSADVTAIGSKKGIGLFRESKNGENPYVYSVEIIGCRDWTTCTAPTAVAAGSETSSGATLTVTDGEDTNDYEFYINTSSTAPTAESSATATSSSKTKVITGLTASSTYYYWVRSNCGGYKSAWVAGTPATFTTSAAATTYSVTYNGNDNTGGSVPTDASTYEEGDLVTVKTNSGSLVKTSSTFVGWSTNATPSSGVFYPSGYKFEMPSSNVTLYAAWASGSASTYYYGSISITAGALTPGSTGGHKGMFTNEGGTIASSTAISLSSTPSETGYYYESSKLTHTELSKSSNWNPSSTSKRTIRAFKFANGTSYTLALGSNTATKITFYGKCGSASRILSVGGVEWTSNSTKETHEYHEFTKDGNFTGNITIGSIDATSSNRGDFYGILVITMAGGASGYTVSFDMNDHGSAISAIENVPSGAKIAAPLPEPTALGYDFGGWYTSANCTTAVDFSTMTIEADKTIYAKWTGCAPTISVHPSGTSYTQSASATALSVTAAPNGGGDLEYQWYSNEENSNEDGTEIPSATSYTYTPSTALIGTVYYYCVVTNECGTVTSNVAAITINDAKSDPKATWTVAAPTHGGKGFSFSVAAKQNDGSTKWDGTLTAAMLSASADVVLSDVTVNNTDKTISGTYGVKASATSPVTFYLELPSTTNCAAATLEKEQSFTACSGTGDDGYTYQVPVTGSYSSKASGKPDYRCETTYGYISPELGASSVSLKDKEYDVFDYNINSGRSSVLIATKVADVKKISIYLNANSGAAQVTNVYTASSYSSALKDYTELSAKTDFSVSYTDEDDNSSIAKGKNGHVDIAFTTNLDNGTLIYVVLKYAAMYYGAKLTTGTGSGATETTALEWSNSQDDEATVEKDEDDAEFTITATRSNAAAQASLGEIRYSSSDTKVATVNATTGQVAIADAIDFGSDDHKTTTIKATLISSGCYKSAAITYTLQVNKSECTEAAGTIEITEDNGCSGVVMTVSGYEEGAGIQWQKNGVNIPSATSTTYTATTSGTYTAVTTNTCARTSNSIVVDLATASASKIVDSWYVKNGRRTPDVALVQTTGATGFTVKVGESFIWKSDSTVTTGFGGCGFHLGEDGIIYLNGTKDNGAAPSDLVAGDATIKITATGCGGNASELSITIHKQAETTKPSVAFVVDGTTRAKGGTATSVSTAKTSERALWTYLSSTFSLTGCNIYWSVDSKELREYYSQYDAIVVTDDPNTQTKGAGDVEYVKAFGTMVDVRPILTMEAYVGRYTDGGWHVYNASPTSPNPRQVEMKLECKNHEIFAGVNEASDNVRKETISGDDYWYITIVDTTQSPYHNTTKDYKDLPALQGFNPSSFSDMLGIGTIHNDALQAGVERQQEPAARMMILGIQNNAMGALTNEGKLIIKNAITYLLKTNMEEVDDCSNYFIGGADDDETNWNNAANWSKNSVPDFTTKARIMAPVVITNGQKIRVAQVDIVVGGSSTKIDADEPAGHVTINPGGALVVGGTVNRATAPHYGIDDLMPTTDEDLIIQANSSNNAALILDNSSGLTGATVQMYSSSYWEQKGAVKNKYWSYVAVPIQEALIPDYFYGAFTYYYEEISGWSKKWDGAYLYPFQAIGLSRDAAGIEHFWGPLVSTESRDIKLTKTAIGGGENLIANSWTAPIQIANFDADDFGDATATVYIYNTGNKDSYAGETVTIADEEYKGSGTAGQWLGIPIGVAKLNEYTGLKVIPAMQSFEVDIPAVADVTETTLHLDYDRLVRGVNVASDNLTEKLHAPKHRMSKNDGDVEAVMKVRVAGVHTLAEVWLIQDGAFNNEGFDNGWEAYYAPCDDRSPQLYAHSEIGNMGIIAKQELEGTILGFAPSRDGDEYTFSFYYRGDEELYLNDLLTETSTLINNEETYVFTSAENGNGSRFIISRNPYQSPQTTTGTEVVNEEAHDKVKKFIYNDKLYILYRGMIFDANGKLINRQ